MSPQRIHHINFIVRDLAEATANYERTLAVDPFVVVDHPLRGASVARTRVGESWLVLVCPYDAESVPGIQREGQTGKERSFTEGF